ncbi:methylamine utilization protein MauE [Micromonospora qiuiae]|uniref:Methylamine utilization protein MauE n=1 Tax=Micromonospora qiuiae TaxID=502268 RepID=A0ABQ4JEU7_9ACTN|nr:MauE/DoxX family redox-associated membrane protein [Micromonospora qiuiae]GIJ28690.1 methylamine utilization protein MauE [Micromonospora qiuiae]
MEYVLIACRCTLALIFLYSASTKLRGPSAFVAFTASLRRLRLLPERLVAPAAVVVVAAELLVPALLASRMTALPGFLAGAALLTAFTAGIILVLQRGTTASCRCFGASDAPLGWQHVVRNCGLLALAVLGLVSVAAADQNAAPAGVALSVGVALVLAFIAATMDDLVTLFR